MGVDGGGDARGGAEQHDDQAQQGCPRMGTCARPHLAEQSIAATWLNGCGHIVFPFLPPKRAVCDILPTDQDSVYAPWVAATSQGAGGVSHARYDHTSRRWLACALRSKPFEGIPPPCCCLPDNASRRSRHATQAATPYAPRLIWTAINPIPFRLCRRHDASGTRPGAALCTAGMCLRPAACVECDGQARKRDFRARGT